MVFLTTYNMIGKSGNEKHPNVLTVGSLELCWLRIVLDKAQAYNSWIIIVCSA
ncbi:hypothetical protein PCANC_25613 [Puccinia coronata f. sp. avenae]|uniref:Uncharacterized protein n=1 Tax=Puccinia coronata f. sp. avenae TaxID=200324 RepID=A0A2N5TSB9_9BASI|nr:hypothetical protein PCANC_25613 [Puccinia coronata f. sp. avenae]